MNPSDMEGPAIYQFGPYRFEPAERRLALNGHFVALTPKCFDVLSLLIRNRGRVVQKSELMQAVWSDSAVEDSSLTVAIAALRKALNDSRGLQRYIETVSKLGYRFTNDVEVSYGPGAGAIDGKLSPAAEIPKSVGSHNQDIPSVAVMPLTDMGVDPADEYLLDGLTESVINALSQLSQLRVMARSTVFRYKGKNVDPRKVGRSLGVQTVLMGTVRQNREDLIVGVELIDVANGWQLWGESYHLPLLNIFEIQDSIAKQISEKLRLKLSLDDRERLTKRYTDNPKAYHAYLMGRYCLTKRTKENFWKAVDYLRLAIELDPDYALAYAGLADCYAMLNSYGELSPQESIVHMKAAAEKALAIDNKLGEAHASLGLVKLTYDWEVAGAADLLKIAITLKPNYVPSHHWYAHCLMIMRQFDKAMNELKIAENLDPMSLVPIGTSIAAHLNMARKYDAAIEQCRTTIELEGEYYALHAHLGLAYSQKGMFSEAIKATQESLRLVEDLEVLSLLGYIYGLSGQKDEAMKLLNHLKDLSKRRYVDPARIAVIYTGLNERDQAFAWFEKAYQTKSSSLVILAIDPRMDSLRPDPRFEDLLNRVGLPSA